MLQQVHSSSTKISIGWLGEGGEGERERGREGERGREREGGRERERERESEDSSFQTRTMKTTPYYMH
jgi:hypothetical protein